MARYTEGERNLRHYLRYGTFPAPPRQYLKQQIDLGNHISDIVGTHYRGERTPRQIQKLPLYNYYYTTESPPPEAIAVPAPFGQAQPGSTDWLLLGGLAVGLLLLFGVVSFKK